MKKHNSLFGIVLLVAALSLQSIIAMAQGAVSSSAAQSTSSYKNASKDDNSAVGKLFQEAISRGRDAQKFYVAINEKGKTSLSVEKMNEYAIAHNYIMGGHKTQEVNRFGDKREVVYKYWFLPPEELPAYAYAVYKFKDVGAPNYTQISNAPKGVGFLYANNKFYKQENIYWTGQLTNGMLSGAGWGFRYAKTSYGIHFTFIKGSFQNGLPLGNCQFSFEACDVNTLTCKFTDGGSSYVNVGQLQNGIASFNEPNGMFGFVQSDGTIIIEPSYSKVIKGFQNGRAEVLCDGKEILIDTKGTFIDHTAKQKQLFAEEKAEAARKAEAEKQAALEKKIAEEKAAAERRRQAEAAERSRKEKFRNCQEGDKVYYVQSWSYDNGFLWFHDYQSYDMTVICQVEKNVGNGERVQVRVVRVHSSSDRRYSTPEIDGIKYEKGDVVWIKPLDNPKWQIE